MSAAPLQVGPVHDAEVAFLTALTEGRQPAPYCNHGSYQGLTVEQHNAQLAAMRAVDKARQRARKAGRAFWQSPRWSITPAGRQWLTACQARAAGVTVREVGLPAPARGATPPETEREG